MLYVDDEARHAFHQTPALLQVVCTILEAFMTEAAVQVRLIDVHKHQGMWMAMIEAPDSKAPVLKASIQKLNDSFLRKDGTDTCVLENLEARLLTVRVTDSQDFAQLN
jgi:hypothetical protein